MSHKGQCVNCHKERWILSKGLCTTCYRKQNKIAECIRCKRVRYIVAKQLCDSCYNNTNGYAKGGKYRRVLRKAGIPVQCLTCREARDAMLDVHHIDKNHKNDILENLAYLCPNHHREAHLGWITISSSY